MRQQITDRPAPVALSHEVETDWVEPYLAFGFVPHLGVADPLSLLAAWSRVPEKAVDDVTVPGLVQEGVRALHAALEECASRSEGGGDHVVFLSGGLDSRTILGGLLGLFDTSQIVAATFGRPGEQDYDFAVSVARQAGVRHVTLESFSVEWTTEGLVESVLARQAPLPSVFGQRYLSYLLHRQLGSHNLFWDGLCGDGVGGKLFPGRHTGSTWRETSEDFLRFHLHPRWRGLVRPGFDPAAFLPGEPFCPADEMTYIDQLVFGVRQRCFTGTRLLRDFPIQTPFLTRPWLDFMLSVPLPLRQDQYLYREIQKAAFPKLSSLPTTALDGGALREPSLTRVLRELSFRGRRKAASLGLLPDRDDGQPSRANSAIRSSYRQSGQVRELVRQNLADLAARGVVDWMDVAAFVPGSGAGADSDQSVVVRLLNLELNLKAADLLV